MAEIWAEVLGLARVGATEDFFDLGGHSLRTTQVVSRLSDAFQVDLSVRSLFEARTVQALAAVVEEAVRARRGVPRPSMERVPREEELPLSFAQERLWFLHRLQPGSTAYNMACAVRLWGPLDLPALERSLREIVRRHESLRTCFVQEERPVQIVMPARALPLPMADLRMLPEEDREATASRLMGKQARLPFDLERGPLLRAILLRLDDEEHVLVAVLHHIAADGWSIGVFLRELAAHYGAFATGSPPSLPDLPFQYADYAVWQRRWLEEGLAQQLAYWTRRLDGGARLARSARLIPMPPGAVHARRIAALRSAGSAHRGARRVGTT